MFKIKGTKLLGKFLSGIMAATIIVCSVTTTAFASGTPGAGNEPDDEGAIISHNEVWVTPLEYVETTIYDLGDGFTATVTNTTEYGVSRASGTKTDTQEIEIKDGKTLAATVKVTGTFSFDGSKATVTSASQTRSVKSGYKETGWGTGKSNSTTLSSAYVSATLTVSGNNTEITKTAKVTCGKNG